LNGGFWSLISVGANFQRYRDNLLAGCFRLCLQQNNDLNTASVWTEATA
jgi:hypothetical protein